MKASYALAATALLACAAATPHHGNEPYHQLNAPLLEQRHADASCECATSYTTFYGEATLIQPNTTTVLQTSIAHVQATVQPVPATTATSEPPIDVTSQQAPEPSTHSGPVQSSHPEPSSSPSSSTVEASVPHPSSPSSHLEAPIKVSPIPSSEAQHAPSSQPVLKHPSPKPHPSPALSTTASQWCMTYSPYTSSGDCKSPSTISTDIASIARAGFSSIRLYSTDCSILSTAAASHNLHLVLGIFIPETGISAPEVEDQISEIVTWGEWTRVEMIVVGNEAVFNGYTSAGELAAFIMECRKAFRAAGYAGPVTTTEPISILLQHSSTLCPALDIAAANIHPFFNADISAPDAGRFVQQELALLESICPGLEEAYVLETGWPSAGEANGEARPGEEEQRVAVWGIVERVGARSAVFGFEDEEWKEEGVFGVERRWGCWGVFGEGEGSGMNE